MSLKKPVDFMHIITSKVIENQPNEIADYEEIDQFKKFPRTAYTIYESILNEYTHEKPTKAHHFIKMLHEEGIIKAYLTNSLDILDVQAGF